MAARCRAKHATRVAQERNAIAARAHLCGVCNSGEFKIYNVVPPLDSRGGGIRTVLLLP